MVQIIITGDTGSNNKELHLVADAMFKFIQKHSDFLVIS